MPRARFYGAVAVAVVVFYYAGTSEVAWLYLLAYWVAALIAMSYLYKRWNRGLRGEIFVRGYEFAKGSPMHDLPDAALNARPAKRAFEGDSISIDLKLVSSRGTRGPARMTGSIGGVELATAAGLVTKKGWTERKLIRHVRRGPVISTGWALDTGDLLGFFKERGTRTQGDTELALVLPRFTSLGARPRVRELEASAASSRAGRGEARQDEGQLRISLRPGPTLFEKAEQVTGVQRPTGRNDGPAPNMSDELSLGPALFGHEPGGGGQLHAAYRTGHPRGTARAAAADELEVDGDAVALEGPFGRARVEHGVGQVVHRRTLGELVAAHVDLAAKPAVPALKEVRNRDEGGDP